MSVQNLTVRRGHVVALDDVSLETPGGRITAVVGGDGAGKSTLLEAMVGLVPATAGTVDLVDRHDIGYMPSGAGSWADLTVDENLAFIGGAYGLTGTALDRRADDLLGRADLLGARDRLVGKLSGGMRQKFGFVLAMLHEPSLLIMDEPTTGVDPVSRVELWRLISEAATTGTAVVISTTYMDEAERAGWVAVLEHGRVLLSGTPDDIIASCPGEVTLVSAPVRAELAWRSGDRYRQWWPGGAPGGDPRPTITLEDVCVVASLRAAGMS
ncbi:MAG: ABC transporter ATP-binding protein [Micrococcales bacterium]|nr:ABC transporter ATP-binding protein [Micrococcales bacterium]